MILAVDPGLRACGVSLWDYDYRNGGLVRASLVRSPEKVLRGPGAWEAMARAVREEYPFDLDALVVEVPQYDARTVGNGATADVFEIFGVAINLVGIFRSVSVLPTVRQWKSNLPKEVTQARLFSVLSDDECANIETDDHNCLDGAALGLWHVTGGTWRRNV